MSKPFNVGFLLYPYLTQLDLTGPAQVFASAPNVQLHYVWKRIAPVPSDAALDLLPTATFSTCPQLDLICVPGGPGQQFLMQDNEVLDWLREQAVRASWITSVCSGSLLLGAAGLLDGYRAASHWNYRHYLPMFGAIQDQGRVVIDRNRLTGGGVTAGIDFALSVIAITHGESTAKKIQLLLEYAPNPPFDFGRPELADKETVAAVQQQLDESVKSLRLK